MIHVTVDKNTTWVEKTVWPLFYYIEIFVSHEINIFFFFEKLNNQNT